MISLSINGKQHQLDVEPDTPLLWVLRDTLGLTGTKYGCGMALCGACTVHINDAPVRSCTTPVSSAAGQKVTTIEGLNSAAGRAVQDAGEKLEVIKASAFVFPLASYLESKRDRIAEL